MWHDDAVSEIHRAEMCETVPTRHDNASVFGICDPVSRSVDPPSTDPRLGAT